MSKKINIVSAFEQFETVVSETANVLGEYHQALIKAGIPGDLAEKLVLNAHQIWWTSISNITEK